MAISVSSVLQFKFFQRYLDQQVLNVQYYRVLALSPGVTTLNGFAEPIALLWQESLAGFQSSALTYLRGELFEVNGILFNQYNFPAGTTGEATGSDNMPPYVCYAIRQNRQTRLTRNGQKRIAGVLEGAQSNGQITNAQALALELATQTIFNGNMEITDSFGSGLGMTLEPIIWGGNDPAYPTGKFNSIVSLSVSRYLTTQNTRKVRTVEGL